MKKFTNIFTIMTLGILIVSSAGLLADRENAFRIKCSKCHALRNPDNYTKEEWKYNVERMAQRAGLTPEEIKQIIDLNIKK